jgi:deazaflavin-dependent oxidoreductase (nitroreductase family)
MPVLLLTSRGHKSGETRDVTLNYLRDDGSYVVVASFAGADRDPAWWRNLRAHPEAEVMVDGRSIGVRASEAEGARRELLWARIVAADRSYDEYQQRTARRIAVVLLEPIG